MLTSNKTLVCFTALVTQVYFNFFSYLLYVLNEFNMFIHKCLRQLGKYLKLLFLTLRYLELRNKPRTTRT